MTTAAHNVSSKSAMRVKKDRQNKNNDNKEKYNKRLFGLYLRDGKR
jgi:hypothetical protein